MGIAGVVIAPVSAAVSSHSSGNCVAANGVRVRNDPLTCKGLSFYKGKTLNLYNIGSIGGPFYNLDLALQPNLAAFLGATVNIVSYTTGNTIPGQDTLAHAAPDGLSIGLLNPLSDISLIATNTPGLNFNPGRLVFLSQSGPSSSPLLTTPGSGYTSFSQLFAASKNGTLKMMTQTTGTANTQLRLWMAALGIKPQWITGYSSLALEVTGFLRHDGPLAAISLSNSCQPMIAGQMVALAINIVPTPGTNCRKFLTAIPTFKSLEKQYPPKTREAKRLWETLNALDLASGTPVVTQTAVANTKIAALRAAIKWTYAQANFKTSVFAFGLSTAYLDPVKAKENFINSVKLGASVSCYLAGTC